VLRVYGLVLGFRVSGIGTLHHLDAHPLLIVRVVECGVEGLDGFIQV